MTMKLIQRQELTSDQTIVTFSSIPQTYTDLFVVFSIRSSRALSTADPLIYRVNNSTSGYSGRFLAGQNTTSLSGTRSDVDGPDSDIWGILSRYGMAAASSTSNTFTSASFYLQDYTVSRTKAIAYEEYHSSNALASARVLMGAYLPTVTSAVTSLSFAPENQNFVAGSTLTLYGITKGTDGITTVS